MTPVGTTALSPLVSTGADPAARIGAPHARALPPAVRPVPAARLVAAADVGLIMCALVFALTGGIAAGWMPALIDFLSARIHLYDTLLLIGFGAAVYFVFERANLYDAACLRHGTAEAVRVIAAVSAIAAVAAALLVLTHPGAADGGALFEFWAVGLVAVGASRLVRAHVSRPAAAHRRVLIVGSGPHARRICRELSVDPLTKYQVLGFVDTADGPRSQYIARRTLGRLTDLEGILVREHVDEVHVGLPVKSHYPQIQDTLRVCERIGVKAMYGADIFGRELARPRVDRAAGSTPRVELLVVADGWPLAVKRAVDIAGAALALLVFSPLMIAAAAAVKLTSAGPVVYAQERYGLNRRRFRMLKFRTMVVDADRLQGTLEARNEATGPVFKIANDPRITPIGRWLRRTSIDELPQLFNVLRGDMSLVGPRPLPLRDVGRFTNSADMRRFSVRPGITGLWQVSGRSRLAFDQWITLDLHYIDHWSLVLDAAILARTLPAVIRGTGAA
jgi:exopolysaccharide biosynthesis polyprenyl glycosylphosphotransferase